MRDETEPLPEPQTTATGAAVYRVRDRDTGHHYTIGASAYRPAKHAILDRPAVDPNGVPRRPTYRAPSSTSASARSYTTVYPETRTATETPDEGTDDEESGA